MKMRKILGVLLFVLPIAFYSCSTTFPIKEMSKAKGTVTKAEEVNADKFFPDEYAEVVSDFNPLHKLIVGGGGNKKMKSSAESITKKANELYSKSLPLAAEESKLQKS